MNNSEMPATACTIHPSVEAIQQAQGLNIPVPTRTVFIGLTKREVFAMAAMQGMLADSSRSGSTEACAVSSVSMADALLNELAK